MARIRTIKPEFCSSPDVGALSRDARLFFLQLLTEADDDGRLLWIPRRLCGVLYPHDDDVTCAMILAWLDECNARNMTSLYTVGGVEYVQIVSWGKHQKISHKATSKLPPQESGKPPEKRRRNSGDAPEKLRGERKGKERNREQGGDEPPPENPATANASPAITSLPLNDGSEFALTEAHRDEFAALFPAVDVPQQFREMRAWALANPTRRKTAAGVLRFVGNWLGREQDKGRHAPAESGTQRKRVDL